MKHEDVPKALPFFAWYEGTELSDYEPIRTTVLEYRLARGATVKTFVCRDDGDTDRNRYQLAVDYLFLTREEAEKATFDDLEKSIDSYARTIEELKDKIFYLENLPIYLRNT